MDTKKKGVSGTVPEWWSRFVADAAAALDKRGDRQMAAKMMELHRAMNQDWIGNHVLWASGDPGVPRSVMDRNGEVKLALCKLCGQGEADIQPTCPGIRPDIHAREESKT